MQGGQTFPVPVYCALPFASEKSWQINMLPNSSAVQLLQLLAPTVNVYPNQIALFLRIGNHDQQVPDVAFPVAVLQQFSSAHPNCFFVIKERVQVQQGQDQFVQQQPSYPQQEEQEISVSSIQEKLKVVKEERSKKAYLKTQLEQQKIQQQESLSAIEKKLIQVQAFASNFPAGAFESLQEQKQQCAFNIQQILQNIQALGIQEQNYIQFIDNLQNQIFRLQQQETKQAQAKTLALASSIPTFIPDIDCEKILQAPEYLVSQVDTILRQRNIDPAGFLLIERVAALFQICPLDNVLRIVAQLSTDPVNCSTMGRTRLVPIFVNLLTSDSLSEESRKTIIWILSVIHTEKSSQDALAQAGAIPPLLTVLSCSTDPSIADSILTLILPLLSNQSYRAVFIQCAGMEKILKIFQRGVDSQQVLIIHMISTVGFSEEKNAEEFIKQPGNLSMVLDVLNTAENVETKETIIRIIISLMKLVPIPMIESGSVARVIKLINAENPNKEVLLLCLESIIPLLINDYVKTIVYQSVLPHLVRLLNSEIPALYDASLKILSTCIYDHPACTEELDSIGGTQKFISLFCSPATPENDLQMVLTILSSLSSVTSVCQLDFVTQGGIEVAVAFLNKHDDMQKAFALLSLIREHYSLILTPKHTRIMIHKLEECNREVSHISRMLASLSRFVSVNNESNMAFIHEGLFPFLFPLLCHPENIVVEKTLRIIQALCNTKSALGPFLESNGVSLVFGKLTSANQNMRKLLLDFVSHLARSNRFRVEYARNNLTKPLYDIIVQDKVSIVLKIVRCFGENTAIQLQIVKTGLLDQILRHLRSKDLAFLELVLETLILVSQNNLEVIRFLISKQTVVYAIRQLESLILRVKMQVTDRLLAIISKILKLLVNLSTCGVTRYHITCNTTILLVLKKLSVLRNPSIDRRVGSLQVVLSFPCSIYDSSDGGSSFTGEIGILLALPLPSDSISDAWLSCTVPLSPLELGKQLIVICEQDCEIIRCHNKPLDDSPLQEEKELLTEKIGNLQDQHSKSQERAGRITNEIARIEATLASCSNEIKELDEMNDDVLKDELQLKREEYTKVQSFHTNAQNLQTLIQTQLEHDKKELENSLPYKKRLTCIIAEIQKKSGVDEESLRLAWIVSLYRAFVTFVAEIKKFQDGYLDSLISPLDGFGMEEAKARAVFVDCKETCRAMVDLSITMIDTLMNAMRCYPGTICIGRAVQALSDLFEPFHKFHQCYASLLNLMKDNRIAEAIELCISPLRSSLQLPPFACFPMRFYLSIMKVITFTNVLQEQTEATHSDYPLLRASMRRFSAYKVNMMTEHQVTQKQVPLKDACYQPLLQLLSQDDFVFMDVFGSLRSTETVVHQILRVFIAQGSATTFLKHQIHSEISETMSKSTLFRGATFATQSLSAFLQNLASSYVHSCLKIYFKQLHASDIDLEVNPSVLGVDADDPLIALRQKLLLEECIRAFSFINGTVDQCPGEVKNICALLREQIAEKFDADVFTSVGGFFFLRFISPCYVTPERFGICPPGQSITKKMRRNCILISKVLQNLSNQVHFGLKEPFMRPMNAFLDDYTPRMKELLSRLSDRNYLIQNREAILKVTDLSDIHSNIYNNRNEIEKKLTERGNLNLVDSFQRVINDLGIPTDPEKQEKQSNQDTTTQAPSKQHKLTRLLSRKKLATVAESSYDSTYYGIAFITSICQKNARFAECIWNKSEMKHQEKSVRAIIHIHDTLHFAPDCLETLVNREVNTCIDPATLFRGNNLAPKYISEYTQVIGKEYLTSLLFPLLNKMVTDDVSFEVDADRLGGDQILANKGQHALDVACREWFETIEKSIQKVPQKIKYVCMLLKERVAAKFPESAFTSIGGLFFLRFICPASIAPERISYKGNISKSIRRNLVLLCKVIQNLSNNIFFLNKELYMVPMNSFIKEYQPRMRALLHALGDIIMEEFIGPLPSVSNSLSIHHQSEIEIMRHVCIDHGPSIEAKLAADISVSGIITLDTFRALQILSDHQSI